MSQDHPRIRYTFIIATACSLRHILFPVDWFDFLLFVNRLRITAKTGRVSEVLDSLLPMTTVAKGLQPGDVVIWTSRFKGNKNAWRLARIPKCRDNSPGSN